VTDTLAALVEYIGQLTVSLNPALTTPSSESTIHQVFLMLEMAYIGVTHIEPNIIIVCPYSWDE